MFGHSNNDNQANGGHPADAGLPVHEPETVVPTGVPAASAPVGNDYVMTDLPHVAAAPSSPVADPVRAAVPAVGSTPTVTPPAFDSMAAAPAAASGASDADADLLELKQSALHELSPLISHLEQSPEEKFRTTMMMIQASDDQSLLQTAFAAAKEIKDEKARAQALLDVVNEINYFTQQQGEAA
jgi:hypothetical protein